MPGGLVWGCIQPVLFQGKWLEFLLLNMPNEHWTRELGCFIHFSRSFCSETERWAGSNHTRQSALHKTHVQFCFCALPTWRNARHNRYLSSAQPPPTHTHSHSVSRCLLILLMPSSGSGAESFSLLTNKLVFVFEWLRPLLPLSSGCWRSWKKILNETKETCSSMAHKWSPGASLLIGASKYSFRLERSMPF